MSHIPQRNEKDCLNCGTVVQVRYCHICGWYKVVPYKSFRLKVKYFPYDINHFDSGFYYSMKNLLYKQGYGKTFFKFLLLHIAGAIMIVFLFICFLLFAVFEI